MSVSLSVENIMGNFWAEHQEKLAINVYLVKDEPTKLSMTTSGGQSALWAVSHV